MSETSRWALPLLDAGQAQKEMTHNEALAALDLLVQASVVAVGVNAPPASPVAGQCWAVGASPTGAWAGQARALAGWTAGGWRFLPPIAGMTVWSAADGCPATYVDGAWRVGVSSATELRVNGTKVVGGREPAIAEPTGGTSPDTEARAALHSILLALRNHGLIAT
jgi:hypothetical protein